MCVSLQNVRCCQATRSCATHYASPIICLVTAVFLAVFGVLCFYGRLGSLRNCSFIGGALIFAAIPFLIAAGYQFSRKCS